MSVDLICPECGGIIGGTGVDAEGRGPCTCFKNEPHSMRSGMESSDDPSDTVSLPSPAAQGHDNSDKRAKLCIVCGKDVTGHRRIKDSRGYLCYACAKDEVRQEREGTIPCAECGRRVKPGGIIVHNGLKICRKCNEDHKETRKKAVKKVATHHFEKHEKRQIIIIAIILLILGLIVLWQQFKPH